MQIKDFYSIADVADQLSLSQKSIRRYIAGGQLDAVKIGGNYRIPKPALEFFINNRVDMAPAVNYDLFGSGGENRTHIRGFRDPCPDL